MVISFALLNYRKINQSLAIPHQIDHLRSHFRCSYCAKSHRNTSLMVFSRDDAFETIINPQITIRTSINRDFIYHVDLPNLIGILENSFFERMYKKIFE